MGRFVVQCEYTCRNGVALWLAPFFFLWGSSISALAGHAGNKKAPHGFIEHAGRGEPSSNDRFSLLAMMQCQRQPETRAVGLPDAASRNRMELDGTSGESPSTNLQVVRQLSNHYGDFNSLADAMSNSTDTGNWILLSLPKLVERPIQNGQRQFIEIRNDLGPFGPARFRVAKAFRARDTFV